MPRCRWRALMHSSSHEFEEPISDRAAIRQADLVELPVARSTPRVFYPQLESLRGIAAFIVVLHHALIISIDDPSLPEPLYLLTVVWSFLFHGGAAVILFFVLSGFVLSLNFDLTEGLRPSLYGRFLIRRVLRLYPVVFVSIVLALEKNYYWGGPAFEPRQIADMFLLRDVTLNQPLWSIQVEALVSGIYPLLLLAFVRGRNAAVGLFLPIALVAYFWGHGPEVILKYLPAFLLGLLIPTAGYDLMMKLGRSFATLSLPVVFCLYSSGIILGHYRLTGSSPALFLQMFGSFYIVAFVAFWGYDVQWLKTGIARWLGRISYSLYALHFPIVGFVASYFNEPSSWHRVVVVLAVSIPLSLLCATIAAHAIEWPFHRLGRKITSM